MPLASWLDGVRRLQAEGVPLSRNRAFDFFTSQGNLQALRHLRRLKTLGRQVRRASAVLVADQGDQLLRLTLVERRMRLRHTVYLTREEAAWLAMQDKNFARLIRS